MPISLVQVNNVPNQHNVVVATVTGLTAGTSAVNLSAGTTWNMPNIEIGTISTTVNGTNYITGTVSNSGLWYFRAQWLLDLSESEITACWVDMSEYRRDDAITLALKDILVNNIEGINAAWRQFATAAGYAVGTVGTANIVIGDRMDPTPGEVTICIVNPSEDDALDQCALGDFQETAYRTIRCYIDLPEVNETDSRETERERLRDTLRSAIKDILMSKQYEELTDANGWRWFACYPTSGDTGEVPKKRHVMWAFELAWQATTQGTR